MPKMEDMKDFYSIPDRQKHPDYISLLCNRETKTLYIGVLRARYLFASTAPKKHPIKW